MKTQFQRLSRMVSTLQGVGGRKHAKAWTPCAAAPRSRGVALVITLILLSVITFMTVTFLVISRREGEQVDTTTQQNVAKFAAEGILQQAESQIAAGIMASRNGYSNSLVVSTNYVSPGYTTGVSNLFNVNYYYPNGLPLNNTAPNYDLWTMLGNLLYLPRAPVFITTNNNQPNPEFRFYLDENGNGVYDTNGAVTEMNASGATVVNTYVGDPEWIGFLEHPDQRHSASNFFLSRGAFIALPIGNSLDINFINNQAKLVRGVVTTNSSAYDGFFRNEGVGSWEINLAAFLGGLNANVWSDYNYTNDPTVRNTGANFYDAAEIMQYRNNGNYNNLSPFGIAPVGLYNSLAASFFTSDFVDGYTVGPLLISNSLSSDPDLNYYQKPWSGADNPVQFIRPRDLLTLVPPYPPTATPPVANSFTNHLYEAGLMFNTNLPSPPPITNSYNRYTFYRMLAQLGIGSAPEPAPYPVGGNIVSISAIQTTPFPTNGIPPYVPPGRNQMSFGTVPEAWPYVHGRKMNLNYNNIGSNGVALTATNFTPWTPAEFFTNAADRLLRTYYPTNFALLVNGAPMVTNLNINFIPIYPVNYYTPAVHRLLQLAANMYDASTNKSTPTSSPPLPTDYPSVFKPYFGAIGSGATRVIYIAGYGEQFPPTNSDPFWNAPLDLRRTTTDLTRLVKDINASANGIDTNDNVYGVPYVIGARPNLPNFNQFSIAPVVQITRTINLTHVGNSYLTNIAYVVGVSNVMGVQCWNSYMNSLNFSNFPSGISIFVTNDFSMLVTNSLNGLQVPVNLVYGNQPVFPLQINPWTNGVNGQSGTFNAASFAIPLMTNTIALPTNSCLLANGYYLTNGTTQFMPFGSNAITHSYFPDWGINMTNRLRVIIKDNYSGRILDYVQLSGLDSQDDVISNLSNMNLPPGYNLWDPTPVSALNALPNGINHQFQISSTLVGTPPNNVRSLVGPQYWASAQTGQPSQSSINSAISNFNAWLGDTSAPSPKQLPFSPTTVCAKVYTWSANDPLVHYMVGDLTDLTKTGSQNVPQALAVNTSTNVLGNLNLKSTRYYPWGSIPGDSVMHAIGSDELEYADPLITSSSAWQFSTNKYPNVGWLGRVHRGTPWQTVYLKSHSTSFNAAAWQYWTGNANTNDAIATQPINDWQLLDLFTTAPNDNASRGQLSVNQTNFAAWAAVLEGVAVLSNSPTIQPAVVTIDPAQSNSVVGNFVQYIVSQINTQQAAGAFSSVGQILAVPQLTTASPYLNTAAGNITDAEYEWIPQQIMGLLRVGTPRYTIYAYGQSLKPAANSIVQSGQFFGMCTNYQITGEVLTRAIVRFDNMPVPGYPAPGQSYGYALPLQNATTPEFVWVTNTMPPMHTVVESYQVLSPDQ